MALLDPAAATISIDMGTTNTRGWLVLGDRILGRSSEMIGLRDAARHRDPTLVAKTLKSTIAHLTALAAKAGVTVDAVLAAGMLTSPLGLQELPHIVSPAGEVELARAARSFSFPEIAEVPFFLVPGVRTGPAAPEPAELAAVDLIRGEETVIVGLLRRAVLRADSTFLHLGSHWKAISLDETRCIASSYTTLSGELLQALQDQTVLASALPKGRIEDLDSDWLAKGRAYFAEVGFGRSLFSVRLLEQVFHCDPLRASSFLLGAVIESDFRGMQKGGHLKDHIVISGHGAPARAWQMVLEGSGKSSTICSAETIESSFLAGLARIFALSRAVRT